MLAHRTDVVISLTVIEQVLHKESIFLIPAFLLLMEHIVLDVRKDITAKEVFIILLTAVARVGNNHIALPAVTFFKTLQERDKRKRIGRPVINGIVGYELIFRSYLYIVTGL